VPDEWHMVFIPSWPWMCSYDLDCECGDPTCEPLYVVHDVGAMAQHMEWAETYTFAWTKEAKDA